MKKYIILLGIAASICACTQTIEDKGEDIDTSGYTVFDVDTEELNLSGAAFSDTWDNGVFIGVF